MSNFKRKHRRSSTMKKCSICGSKRRYAGRKSNKGVSGKKTYIRHKHIVVSMEDIA